ncbi:hypothetical protein [Streptomyces swartbergensis]|uniref:hypothetical protein n=1 Tax=Streptomyces swartbergensis TaxID=487165 RepID=UPI001ABFD57F|nr:hypothetical protein [Streptomyces swartbergensis]
MHLKNWRVLTKLRQHICHATTLPRDLLVLSNLEVSRCQRFFAPDNRPRQHENTISDSRPAP